MKRLFDPLLALAAAVVLAMPVLLLAVAVRLTSLRPVLYGSNSLGRRPPAMSMGNNSGLR